MTLHADVMIVGGGPGGAQAAISLRQGGFAGTIALVSEELEPPYERPPLSKDYLASDRSAESLLIRPLDFWRERNVELRLGTRVDGVDAARHRVRFANGAVGSYGSLVWAAGGRPRRLTCPGSEFAGTHTIRTRPDVDRLLAELPRVNRVAVVGAGFIGLEVAATLVKSGKSVVVLEMADRVLGRVAAPPISQFYEREHRAHGVDLRLGVTIDAVTGRDGAVTGVRLASGEVVDARVIIVGIGTVAAVEPLLSAGARGDGGVDVDDGCRTSLPDILAIGDCALHENHYAKGRLIRLESVQNAADQAMTAAATIMGTPRPQRPVPSFWSNQYDLKLQTVGLSIGYDDTVLRGDPATRSFSLVYLRHGVVIALDCVNNVRDFVQGRALVAAGVAADRERLADVRCPLKSLCSPVRTPGD